MPNSHYTQDSVHAPQRPIHPFVKWAGGKTQLLFELCGVIPSEFDRYFEPFLGGAVLFFHLMSIRNRRFAPYLSDLNKELITTYKIMKDNVKELIRLLERYDAAYREAPSGYYYKLRDRIKPKEQPDLLPLTRHVTMGFIE